MVLLLDPRTTFSIGDSEGISTYFDKSASKNECPRMIDGLGRMKDAEFGMLKEIVSESSTGEPDRCDSTCN